MTPRWPARPLQSTPSPPVRRGRLGVAGLTAVVVLAGCVDLLGLTQDASGGDATGSLWRVGLLLVLMVVAGFRWLRRGGRRRRPDDQYYSHHDGYGGSDDSHDGGDDAGGDGGGDGGD